jgi:D-tyrosyl-tRNA(Tyr) deacylase
MRAIVQRVLEASVTVEENATGQIQRGLLIYLGVTHEDDASDVQWLADKVVNLRIFSDADAKMNLSVIDVSGEILLISQFTLCGDCRKGRRPGFDQSADPDLAKRLYEQVIESIRDRQVPVQTGRFGAHMEVRSTNDGPVTFLLDSKKLF